MVDGGEGLDVEAFVVGVADGFVDGEAFDQEDADADVDFGVGGQPDFVVEIGLLEDKAGAFLEIGEEAAGEAEITDEIGFETGHVVGLLVNPDDASEFLDDFFLEVAGFVFGVGLKIEHQDVLPVEAFVTRIDELRDAEKGFDADVFVVLVFFAFFFCLLILGIFFGVALLNFGDFFLSLLVFFLLVIVTEGLAVFFDEGGDFFTV